MESSKPQHVTVFVHEDKKLVGVSINNVDSHPTNKTLPGKISKCKSYYRNLKAGNRNSNITRQFSCGLYIALVNTEFEGWKAYLQPGEYTLEDAVDLKRSILDDYSNRGYKNVGARDDVSKGGSGTGSTGWGKPFNVNNMNQNKILQKIQWLGISMGMEIPESLVNKAYLALIRRDGTIENNATLLLFLRKELNLP